MVAAPAVGQSGKPQAGAFPSGMARFFSAGVIGRQGLETAKRLR